MARLILDPASWIHRRVEQIEYLDQRSVRRRLSIDLTVPTGWPDRDDRNPFPYLPIAQFIKEPLTRFDFVNEAGEPLPMLTAEENGQLSIAMLRTVARVPNPRLVDLVVDRYIETLVLSRTQAERREAFRKIFQPSTEVGRVLWDFSPFRVLTLDLATNFVVYLPVSGNDSGRRILKMNFDRGEPSPRPRRLSERLGLRPVTDRFWVPAAAAAASYHVEVSPPDDMRIVGGSFVSRKGGEIVSHRVEPSARTIHFNLARLDRRSGGAVRLAVRADSTVLSGAALFAVVSTVALWFVRARLDEFAAAGASDAVVAALLAGPGLLLAYLVRPTEHPIATTFLSATRVLAVMVAVLAFAAAIVLFAGYEEDTLRTMYLVAAIASSICAGGLASGWLAQLGVGRQRGAVYES